MTEVEIYQSQSGDIELSVSLSDETVWLSLNQLVTLFGRDKSVISRHLNNILKEEALDREAVVAKNATTGSDGKTYQVDYYNLDVIISLGYRVKSNEGIRFRQWATSVLKQHLIKGYSVHEKRLAEVGTREMEQSLELLQKTLTRNELVTEVGRETIQLIINYSKTWKLLLAYDEEKLQLPKHKSESTEGLSYEDARVAIDSLKTDLMERGDASELFGQEKDDSLKGILGNIEQTFDGENLYKTIEERAAHLLYFIIKDHPFNDGNKRIGCLIFLMYLKLQARAIRLNDNGLVALALLVAESEPLQKDLIVRLIVNILIDEV